MAMLMLNVQSAFETDSKSADDSGNFSLRGGPFEIPDQINDEFDEPDFFLLTVISNEPRRDIPCSLITSSNDFFGKCALKSLNI